MPFDPALISHLKNVHTYAVTPFREENLTEIDHEAFARNLEFLIAHGVQVIAVGGGTGEIEALSVDELEQLAATALRVAGDRALVITCLPANLKEALDLCGRYERLGSRILLGMPPLIRGKIPADLQGVHDFFRLVSRATGVPLMPYNTQGWPAEFFVQLAEIETIIGIKDPCQTPHEFFRAIQMLGDRFVWIGNKKHDPGVAHLRYQMGMQGFTSGQSNFHPEPELAMHAAAVKQDWEAVVQIQNRIAPLERLRLAHDDAAMVKAGMDLVGLHGGPVRPPRRDAPDAARASLRSTLQSLGVECR
jgi:dihydrodipicolinate synthase/N-acetylneuraminate lyase